ncbi:MAG: TonB-dependent receptor plug domain-containing protein, partial [Asticcacaulis sp.]
MPVRFMLRVSTLALVLGSLAPCHALADELVAETGQTPDSQVAEIVVTGQKVRRTIQATDTSVAVLTPKRLQDEHIQSLFDVIRRTPNMNETFGDMGFTLRGITNASLTGGVGSLATVYVDGAPMADRALVSGPMEMWDIGQVEV